jgi:hypothetical protein
MDSMRELIDRVSGLSPDVGDGFLLEFGDKIEVETEVTEITENGDIVLYADDQLMKILETLESVKDKSDKITFDVPLLIRLFEFMREDVKSDVDLHDVVERIVSMKNKGTLTMDDYKSIVNGSSTDIEEAKYHGRTVPLGKPMKGDVKKSKVYVRDPKTGNVKKVNFGDKKMSIKKHLPGHRKSFRARHHCDNPGPRTKARYWSCRAW